MKKASLLIDKGNYDEGLSIYLDLEKNAIDQSFRDIATILYVLNSMDKTDSEVLLRKIQPLENSKVWQSSALELKAFIYLKDKFSISEKFFSILLSILSATFCQPDVLYFVISGYSNSEKNSASRQRSNPFSISNSSKTVF